MPIASTSGDPWLQNYKHKLSLFSIDCPTITAKLQGVCCRYMLLISIDRGAALCLAGISCDWLGGNWEEDLDILPVDVEEEYWKGGLWPALCCGCGYGTSSRLPGSKVGEILVYVALEWVVIGRYGGYRLFGVYRWLRETIVRYGGVRVIALVKRFYGVSWVLTIRFLGVGGAQIFKTIYQRNRKNGVINSYIRLL